MDSRLARINNGEHVCVLFESNVLRAYEFYNKDGVLVVNAKKKGEKAVSLDYERSEDAKDALYVGENISETEYNTF